MLNGYPPEYAIIFFILQIYKIKNTRLKLESRIFHLHKIFYSAVKYHKVATY